MERNNFHFSKGIALLLFGVSLGPAQHNHQDVRNNKPAELLEGLGKHTHPIRTSSPEAQKFFDQGLALVFGFNHDEAARLFARAAELDPKSPMPHWGIALALGPNYNMPPMPEREEQAWKAIEKAVALSGEAPENERAYVEALTKRYSKDPQADRKQLAVVYKDAMKTVMGRYPDDLDAATFYAESLMNLRPWQLWSPAGEPAEGTLEVVEVLERVLRRDPDHPGANHYYIHAVEASKNPERALPSALRLGALMPGAGHLVHMPSHIFLRTGDYEASAAVNVIAAAVDKKYIERSGAKGIYPLMYYSHNLHFVAFARMFQGKYDESIDYARRLRANVGGAIEEMPMLAAYGAFEWLVYTTFGKWDEMLAQSEPKEKVDFLQAMYRYARAAAFAGKGRAQAAQAEQERMQTIVERIPEGEMLMVNTARNVLAVALADVGARISRCKGDSEAEVAQLRRAVEMQDALNYMEPPDWHYTVRTSLGGALLRANKAVEAEEVFRKDLELHPRNGRSLFGLVKALEAQSKSLPVEWVSKEYNEAWRTSPLSLTVDSL
jgi:tetratricopeptide (TPR) repeat protein